MRRRTLTVTIMIAAAAIIVAGIFGCRRTEETPQSAEDVGASAESIGTVVKGNNQFAFDLYADLATGEDGNVFFSPYSISVALAMAYEGARGSTADEIRSVFHFPQQPDVRRPSFAAIHNQLNQKHAKYELHVANALWVQEGYPLPVEYADTIRRHYAGEARNVDFARRPEETRKTINRWVEDRTKEKIKDLFPEGSLEGVIVALTNAIYFKGTWVLQFDESRTREEEFRVSQEKTVQVPMMRLTGEEAEFPYAETEELQILEMPYKGDELSMLVLLPKGDELKSLEQSLSPDKLGEWKQQLRKERVDVFLPKFTMKTKYTLNENLIRMGMPSAFESGAADFAGIDGGRGLFISLVVHQAFVDVNEKGTEAAAATAVTVKGQRMMARVFRADHPFLFLILQNETGNVLFLGRVSDPSES